MEGFKNNTKMKCFKEGGSVKYESRKEHKEEVSADVAQDKKIVKKAFKIHDTQSHEGEKTNLSKLKKGGRAKKEAGSVKKFEKASGEYGAKKGAVDKKNIKEAKQFKPTKLCGGKSVKKMADGGDVGSDPYDIGGGALRAIGKVPMVGGALQSGATTLRDNILGTPEQNRIAQAQMDKVKARKAAEAAALLAGKGGAGALQQGAMAGALSDKDAAMAPSAPTNQPTRPFKKGGKAKKMNTGGTCS